MPPELTILALAALLQFAQLAITVVLSDLQTGLAYGAGPRDQPRPLTGLAGRMDRALANHSQALLLFAIAVLVLIHSGGSSPLTTTAAWIYLAARIAYVPAYGAGIPLLRSLIWAIGQAATLTILITAIT